MKRLPLLLCFALVWAAAARASDEKLDVVDKLRREQQATPTNTWSAPVNMVRGRVTWIKRHPRPWWIGMINDRGYKYDFIIGRDSHIYRGSKTLTDAEFIEKVKPGDWLEVNFTNNKDQDPITTFIRYPEKTTVLSVTGPVTNWMGGPAPRIIVRSGNKDYNLLLPANVKIRKDGKILRVADFLSGIRQVPRLKADYTEGERDLVARTLEILPAEAPAPAAPPAPAEPPKNLRKVSGFIKAFKPGYEPRLLLQAADGKEVNARIDGAVKIRMEGKDVGLNDFFAKLRSVRFYEVTVGDIDRDLLITAIEGTNAPPKPAA
ncbi:MAG TPA: hypothetical protein VL404_04250 [Candidatus Eisenbacteria bacterium]|jgi:hypothetical protein|nr:hypothetical protein [Candidatus Eisenbacteria bacterium]